MSRSLAVLPVLKEADIFSASVAGTDVQTQALCTLQFSTFKYQSGKY